MLSVLASSLLLIIIDDVGAEHCSWTTMGQDAGNPVSAPVMEGLAAEGITYQGGFWVAPNCSPTRAAIFTGLYGHRTGVGTKILPWETFELPRSEVTLAERLSARGYATAMVGKWHMGQDPEHACDEGFDLFCGTTGTAETYYDWTLTQDTPITPAVTTYEMATHNTVYTTDAALAWLSGQVDNWFCVVSYTAAHGPWEAPPGYSGPTDDLSIYRAIIEHLDGELGRLLAGVDLDETTVLLLSDNGSPRKVVLPPNTKSHSKGSAYRGGVETFLIAAGGSVRESIDLGNNSAGQVFSGLCHAVDVHKTVLRNLPGTDPFPPPGDSDTLYQKGKKKWRDGPKEWAFTERFEPNGPVYPGPKARGVEEMGWKMVVNKFGQIELYDVVNDPWELNDVAARQPAQLAMLLARLQEIGL